MTTLIFLFAILTAPQDRILCELWTRALTQPEFDAACGVQTLAGLRVDVFALEDGALMCSKPAEDLPRIVEACLLEDPLDHYRLRLVKPNHSDLACMVETTSEETPSVETIQAQCPQVSGLYVVQFAGTRQATDAPRFACPTPLIPTGAGLYEQTSSAADLATLDDLPMLTERLIWFAYADDESARSLTLVWQNLFDEAIHAAALEHHVPARLLKRIIRTESQYWPLYDKGADGEVGIMQITDNGLDTLLRWDPWLDPAYGGKSDDAQAWSRNMARENFVCFNCSMVEVIAKIKTNMPIYARTLAAFHCRAVTLNPALSPVDAWRQTVVDYNGAGEYLLKIEE